MSATTVLPTITDAMTGKDIMTVRRALEQSIGPKAEVCVLLTQFSKGIHVAVRPDGEYGQGAPYFTFDGTSWPEAFAKVSEWVPTYVSTLRNATIRSMALAIIEITDEHGKCTQALLKAKRFTPGQIAEFSDAACVRAGEMCVGAPFVVL